MKPEQWATFKKAARLEKLDKIPLALIIDSPWVPGDLGLNHMDYFLDPELWFQSNLKIHKEFPDIIFVPSWWMEYGMAAEPSALGAKLKFWKEKHPPRRQDKVLAGQHSQRVPHALPHRGYREISRLRSRSRRVHGHDIASYPD